MRVVHNYTHWLPPPPSPCSELRRQRHSVPSQAQYAQQLSILNQQLQLGAPGGSGSSLVSTAVISGSSSAPELKSLFTPVTAIGA